MSASVAGTLYSRALCGGSKFVGHDRMSHVTLDSALTFNQI